MTDPVNTIATRIDLLQSALEHPGLDAAITLGFQAEAADHQTLADRMDAAIRETAADEGRPIVTIDLGGVLGTDDSVRCWGTITLAASNETA